MSDAAPGGFEKKEFRLSVYSPGLAPVERIAGFWTGARGEKAGGDIRELASSKSGSLSFYCIEEGGVMFGCAVTVVCAIVCGFEARALTVPAVCIHREAFTREYPGLVFSNVICDVLASKFSSNGMTAVSVVTPDSAAEFRRYEKLGYKTLFYSFRLRVPEGTLKSIFRTDAADAHTAYLMKHRSSASFYGFRDIFTAGSPSVRLVEDKETFLLKMKKKRLLCGAASGGSGYAVYTVSDGVETVTDFGFENSFDRDALMKSAIFAETVPAAMYRPLLYKNGCSDPDIPWRGFSDPILDGYL